MPRPRWIALLLVLLLPRPVAAEEPVWREPLWLQPPGADAPLPVLLTLPVGWQPGDAAVVILPDPDAPQVLRHRAVRTLLAAAAAVVELDPVAASVELPAMPPYPALDPADQPAALRAALLRLRAETGAGLLVALGLGAAGEVALAAAAEPDLAAAAALGGGARFLPGVPPPAAQQWPMRARLLCAALAEVAGGAAAQRDCQAALLLP